MRTKGVNVPAEDIWTYFVVETENTEISPQDISVQMEYEWEVSTALGALHNCHWTEMIDSRFKIT